MAKKASQPRLIPNERTGIYYIHWSEGGRTFRRSCFTTDEQIAKRIEAQFILKGTETFSGNGTILPTIEQLLKTYEKQHVRKKVRARDTFHYIEKNLLPFFGAKLPKEIRPEDVYRYEELRAAGIIGNPSKPATVRRELTVLIAAINHAIKGRVIGYDEKPYIPLPDDSVPRDRWLTREEMNRVYDACPVDDPAGRMTRAFRFAKIAVNTGARRGAIEELTWDQVDFENEVIHFNPSGRRQTKKRRASVPINTDLLMVLERAWDERVSDFVLDTDKDVYAEFKAACRRAGIEDVSPHTLRHTYGTWAAQRGVPIWKIAGVMGDTVETASKHYLHHCPDELRDAV